MATTRHLTRLAAPLAAIALTGAIGATAGAEAADAAAKPKAAVSVTIKLNDTSKAIKGTVSSPRQACKAGRGVQLFYKAPGGTSFMKVRTATSAQGGAWKVPAPGGASATIPPGKYYVKIVSNASCKAAMSRTITAAAG